MPEYYLGLMSGTSVDGIDAALGTCRNDAPHLSRRKHFSGCAPLRKQILATIDGHRQVSLMDLGAIYPGG